MSRSLVAKDRPLPGLTHLRVTISDGFYLGPGRAAVGAQGEYVKREAFEGIGGAPRTDDAIIMTSFRYYPFK